MKLLRIENSRYLLCAMLLSFAVNSKAQLIFTDSGQRLGNGSSNDVALGDLDGDGDLDAFVINGDWNAEQPNEVWFNDSNGNYTVSDQVFGNSKCGEVGLADLDGDGDLDAFIAYYNYMGGEPDQVWFNDGTGHFTDSGQRLDHRNGGVALADLDGDGDIDAFICNHVFDNGTNGNLKIWLNDGTGHFTDSGQELGNGNHTSVSLGDVDGDGDMDALVTFNYGDAGNRIWLNDGHARFTQGPLISMTFSGDAKLGDLDGDADLDIFLTHRGGNKVWFNDGAGHFTDSGQVLGHSETSAVGLGDLDKDGDLDAFVLNAIYQNARTNEIWINNGAGIFTDSGLRPGYDQSYDAELGDLDGDKDLDVFIAITGPNKVWINGTYPSGYMKLSFTANGQNITSSASWDIRMVDFDGDLDLDAYFENKVWLNNGAGLFARTTITFGAKDAYFADFNGDGFMDAVCNDSLFLNDKSFHYPFSGRITSNMQMTYAQPADVDGDGDIDMIVADQYIDSLFVNDGSGIFTTAKRSFGGWSQCRYEAGDINGDGCTDIVVGIPHTPPPEMLPSENKIWIRDKVGNYTLKHLNLSSDVQTRNINLADFDKDGDLDLLIAGCEPRSGNPYSTILQNDGNGNFSVKQKLNEGFQASDSKIADFDNDGDLDVFFSNGTPTDNGSPNTLWLNDGFANFIDSDLQLGNSNSLKAAVGDLNADGKTDVLAVNAKLDPQNGYVAIACPIEVWLNNSHRFDKTGYENRFIEGSLFVQSDNTAVTCGSYQMIHSNILGEDRTLLIRLPDDYGKSDKKYPVLYKLDGEKGNFLQAFSAAYYLFDMTGMVPDHIIVGIENTDRNRDMRADAGASNFIEFLQSELIPFINKKYRTNDFSILCGQSSSAVFALYSFLKQPDLFDAYILGSFGLYRESLSVLFENELKRNDVLKSIGKKYIYVANGKQDSYDPDGTITKRGDQFLESVKQTVSTSVLLKYKMYEEEGHVPYYTIYDGLKWIYAQNADDLSVLKGDYFGQTPPGDTPVVFARGIISDSYQQHGAPSFSPDGKKVFWQTNQRPANENEKWPTFSMTMQRVGDVWTAPEISPYGSMPFYSPDGKRIYFAGKKEGDDPYYVEKQVNSWSEPKSIGLISRFPELEKVFFPSIASNGTIYFMGHAEGLWLNIGIYRAEIINGEYTKPELLPPDINAPGGIRNWAPFIAPDESYLIFCSTRGLPAYDQGDLHICFRQQDGSWTDPVSMGAPINTSQMERFSSLSPDGKYLFFTRDTPGYDEDVYWVSASIIEKLRNDHLKKK